MSRSTPSARGKLTPSRLGGVPAVPGPPAPATGTAERQLAFPIATAHDRAGCGRRSRHEVAPGVVHVAGWLDDGAQRALAAEFRRWAAPPAGLRHPRVP